MTINGWEWVIILVVILLVFGVGRIGKLGAEFGKGISGFRQGMRDNAREGQPEETDGPTAA